MSSEKPESIKILLNPGTLGRKKIWDISIYLLLKEFYEYLRSQPLIDYRLSGVAVLTSSILYKLKVQNLFYEEKRRVYKRSAEVAEPIEPLHMPFRIDLQASDIDDLLFAFESLILEVEREKEGIRRETLLRTVEEFPVFDQEMLLKMLRPLEEELVDRLEREGEMKFSDLIRGKDALEVVRYLIILLFLAQDEKVVLVQQDEDILIVGVERVEG